MAEGGSKPEQGAPEQDRRIRLLLFSDLHLDRPYEWASQAIAESRRAAAREALVAIMNEARHRSVDAIACAGDLFNRRSVKPANVQWLAAAFRSAGIPVLIAPGNEDFIGPLGGYKPRDWPENVTIFDTDRFSPIEIMDGVAIWGAAHTEAHRAWSFLDGFTVDRPGVNIALFHGAETGGRGREPDLDPCAVFDESDIEGAGFDHALVGHYQQPHFGPRHTYPGAPLAHGFGPGSAGGAVLVTFNDDGTTDRDYIPLPSPELHDVDVDVTGARSKRDVLQRARSSVGDRSGVIRLSLRGHLSPDVVLRREDFADLNASSDNLLLEWNAEIDIDLDQLAEEHTIRGQFVRDVLASTQLPDERRQRVLLVGLRALAGQHELEGLR